MQTVSFLGRDGVNGHIIKDILLVAEHINECLDTHELAFDFVYLFLCQHISLDLQTVRCHVPKGSSLLLALTPAVMLLKKMISHLRASETR